MSGHPFKSVTAVALPLLRDNVNTDAIIPSREMKHVSRRGLADGLFADWRYIGGSGREPNGEFELNDPRYAGCAILLTGANFGCGSSREHAAWALAEYGFRAILAESFNPIFRGNAILNGIVPVILAQDSIRQIAEQVAADPVARPVTVDLESLAVTAPDGTVSRFSMDSEPREMLLYGLDTIDLTLRHKADIAAFRNADRRTRPWAYGFTGTDGQEQR
jgi:3-isopropylmalate/(R)-2-methylmalate dehydratase small subunit